MERQYYYNNSNNNNNKDNENNAYIDFHVKLQLYFPFDGNKKVNIMMRWIRSNTVTVNFFSKRLPFHKLKDIKGSIRRKNNRIRWIIVCLFRFCDDVSVAVNFHYVQNITCDSIFEFQFAYRCIEWSFFSTCVIYYDIVIYFQAQKFPAMQWVNLRKICFLKQHKFFTMSF